MIKIRRPVIAQPQHKGDGTSSLSKRTGKRNSRKQTKGKGQDLGNIADTVKEGTLLTVIWNKSDRSHPGIATPNKVWLHWQEIYVLVKFDTFTFRTSLVTGAFNSQQTMAPGTP
jgi:hypothetical protein